MPAQILLQNLQESGIGRISMIGRMTEKRGVIHQRRLEGYAWVWISGGSGWLEVEGAPRTPIEEGQSFLLLPGQEHSYRSHPGTGWDEWFVLFSGPVFDLWVRQGLLEHPVSKVLSPEPGWHSSFAALGSDGSPLERVCALQGLLAKAWNVASPADTTDWIQQSSKALHTHRLKANPVQQTARDLGLSHQTFRKRFRKETGMAPGAYVRNLVMEEAAERILMEDIPIKELALELGFCDEFYFTRKFREAHGLPPASYRKQFQ